MPKLPKIAEIKNQSSPREHRGTEKGVGNHAAREPPLATKPNSRKLSRKGEHRGSVVRDRRLGARGMPQQRLHAIYEHLDLLIAYGRKEIPCIRVVHLF